MWLGLGHRSGKKALCLGICFQKQVVNPDPEFHETQFNLRKKIILETEKKFLKKNSEYIYIICIYLYITEMNWPLDISHFTFIGGFSAFLSKMDFYQ